MRLLIFLLASFIAFAQPQAWDPGTGVPTSKELRIEALAPASSANVTDFRAELRISGDLTGITSCELIEVGTWKLYYGNNNLNFQLGSQGAGIAPASFAVANVFDIRIKVDFEAATKNQRFTIWDSTGALKATTSRISSDATISWDPRRRHVLNANTYFGTPGAGTTGCNFDLHFLRVARGLHGAITTPPADTVTASWDLIRLEMDGALTDTAASTTSVWSHYVAASTTGAASYSASALYPPTATVSGYMHSTAPLTPYALTVVGFASRDPDGIATSTKWAITNQPAMTAGQSSLAALSSTTGTSTNLTCRFFGDHEIRVRVADSTGDSVVAETHVGCVPRDSKNVVLHPYSAVEALTGPVLAINTSPWPMYDHVVWAMPDILEGSRVPGAPSAAGSDGSFWASNYPDFIEYAPSTGRITAVGVQDYTAVPNTSPAIQVPSTTGVSFTHTGMNIPRDFFLADANCGVTTGTSTAYVCTPSPAVTSIPLYGTIAFKAHVNCGVSPTLQISALPALPVFFSAGCNTTVWKRLWYRTVASGVATEGYYETGYRPITIHFDPDLNTSFRGRYTFYPTSITDSTLEQGNYYFTVPLAQMQSVPVSPVDTLSQLHYGNMAALMGAEPSNSLNYYHGIEGAETACERTAVGRFCEQFKAEAAKLFYKGANHGYAGGKPRGVGWASFAVAAAAGAISWADITPVADRIASQWQNPNAPIQLTYGGSNVDDREHGFETRFMAFVALGHTDSTVRTRVCDYVRRDWLYRWKPFLEPEGYRQENLEYYGRSGFGKYPSAWTGKWGVSPWRSVAIPALALHDSYRAMLSCGFPTEAAELKAAVISLADFYWKYGRSVDGGTYYTVQMSSYPTAGSASLFCASADCLGRYVQDGPGLGGSYTYSGNRVFTLSMTQCTQGDTNPACKEINVTGNMDFTQALSGLCGGNGTISILVDETFDSEHRNAQKIASCTATKVTLTENAKWPAAAIGNYAGTGSSAFAAGEIAHYGVYDQAGCRGSLPGSLVNTCDPALGSGVPNTRAYSHNGTSLMAIVARYYYDAADTVNGDEWKARSDYFSNKSYGGRPDPAQPLNTACVGVANIYGTCDNGVHSNWDGSMWPCGAVTSPYCSTSGAGPAIGYTGKKLPGETIGEAKTDRAFVDRLGGPVPDTAPTRAFALPPIGAVAGADRIRVTVTTPGLKTYQATCVTPATTCSVRVDTRATKGDHLVRFEYLNGSTVLAGGEAQAVKVL